MLNSNGLIKRSMTLKNSQKRFFSRMRLVASRLNRAVTIKFRFIFQLAILLILPSLTIGQNIHIKVYNKTGYNLDSVSFHHFYLGKISKDSAVSLFGINEIIMQGAVPLSRPFAIIEDKKRPYKLKSCATKSMKKKSGSYAFDIFINERGNDYWLYWKKHE